jgi:Ca2+/Na+ antiporter
LTKVKSNDTPALNAMLLLAALQGMNISTGFGIINYFYEWKFDNTQVTIGALSLCIIMIIHNYIFLFNKRDKIIKRYQNETKEDKTWGIIGLLLYIVVSITIFFVVGETLVQKHY